MVEAQQRGSDAQGRNSLRESNFKEQNLLIVDKKKKFVPAQGGEGALSNADQEGVLSIPPEDPPNNCKSKLVHALVPRDRRSTY